MVCKFLSVLSVCVTVDRIAGKSMPQTKQNKNKNKSSISSAEKREQAPLVGTTNLASDTYYCVLLYLLPPAAIGTEAKKAEIINFD